MVSKYAKDDKLYPKDLSKRARVDHRLHYENGVLFQVIKDMVVSIRILPYAALVTAFTSDIYLCTVLMAS